MEPMSPKAIQLDHVVKQYSGKRVLDNLTLSVKKGEFLGFVGINGAGKTTLIKCVLDLCSVDDGTISIFGVDNQETTARDRVSYLPERFNIPGHLTGRNFLDYALRLHGVAIEKDRIATLLQSLDLDPAVLDMSSRKYSKGMAQKLGLASSILSGKGLMIFDEPMSGLDPQSRTFLKNVLVQAKQQGRTLFMSTHMLADVANICDRMAVLHQGRLQFIGSPNRFATDYRSDDLDQAFMNCISRPTHA